MRAELVTTGWQVEVTEDKKRTTVGRIYHVQESAQQLCDLLRAQGKDAVVASIRKFEGESKRVR